MSLGATTTSAPLFASVNVIFLLTDAPFDDTVTLNVTFVSFAMLIDLLITPSWEIYPSESDSHVTV